MAFCATSKLNILNPALLTSTKDVVIHDPLKRVTPARISGGGIRVAASGSGSGAPAAVEAYEEGQLERPRWTGETPLSRFVGALISFKPLYSLLKLGARQVFIRLSQNTMKSQCSKVCVFFLGRGKLQLLCKRVHDKLYFMIIAVK